MESKYEILEQNPHPNPAQSTEASVSRCNLFLDQVGEVSITQRSDGICCKLAEDEEDKWPCLASNYCNPNGEIDIDFRDVYAVKFLDWGLVYDSVLSSAGGFLLGRSYEMYRFELHVVQKSKTQSSLSIPSIYTFGHQDKEICTDWITLINSFVEMEAQRPKNLLVFVHPRSGKGQGCKTWEEVAPLFSQAKVTTKVVVTERAGHARDMMASISDRELSLYDGVVTVGGDGFFNEVLNGLLLSRHKAPYPPEPGKPNHPIGSSALGPISADREEDIEFALPNKMFRFGIIPAGSTDAIVMCTTGARDPITSALHIVLGKKVDLDIAQVVRWKTTQASNEEEPTVHYAASFAGYGFYGDVITESEKYRWMGPKRYDYAGTKVFLKHRSYEAEVHYLEADSSETSSTIPRTDSSTKPNRKKFSLVPKQPNLIICRANCNVCNSNKALPRNLASNLHGLKWSRSKGRYLSVGAAVISCRNEKAPDGLVADAHLSDGFLHLVLIKKCPHPSYLWHLIQLARKGGHPLDFDFVEHHKTPAFTFKSSGKEGMWNVDGELFQAHKLSAQVFRGLVSLFAAGPEV